MTERDWQREKRLRNLLGDPKRRMCLFQGEADAIDWLLRHDAIELVRKDLNRQARERKELGGSDDD